MARLLPLLFMAFKVWMLIDAYKRRAPGYWYFIIFLPFGAVAYFFMMKLPDLQKGVYSLGRWFRCKP